MPLVLDKLENIHRQGTKILARCPACAETGHDAAGDHLVIYEQGHFACVVHPGSAGKSHRGRIFHLAGDTTPRTITVRPASRKPSGASRLGILVRLGRVFGTQNESAPQATTFPTESVLGVPNVPKLPEEQIWVRLGRVPQTLTCSDKTITNIKEFLPPVPSVPKTPNPRRSRYWSKPDDLTDAARLSDWLTTAALPGSFALSAWERVVQADLFRNRLLLDLTYRHTAMFAPALDRARRVHALFQEKGAHAPA